MNPLDLLKKYWKKQSNFKKVTKREILKMIRTAPLPFKDTLNERID